MNYCISYFISFAKNIEYKNLGYSFYLGHPELEHEHSVDNHRWNDIDDILHRCEEILLTQKYINLPEEENHKNVNNRIPIEVYTRATKVITKALQKDKIIPYDFEEAKIWSLDNILLRSLQHFNIHSFEHIYDETGKPDPISLREFELELKQVLMQPKSYFIGNWREIFYGQSDLHDEEWLAASLLEEEEEEKKEQEDRILYDHNWSELKITMREKRGYGQGEKDTYCPWLITDDMPLGFKETMSITPSSWISRRTYYLLGDLERAYFQVLNWDKEVVDMRESFPLDRDITIRLAKQLKIKHPHYEKTDIPQVLTTSFLVTRDKAGVKEMQAVSLYWSNKIKAAQMNNIKLLTAYWQEKGIEHVIVTEENINVTLVINMNIFDGMKYAHRYVMTESSCIHTIEQLKIYREKSPNMTIKSFVEKASTSDTIPAAVRGAIKFLIANRVIKFPLEKTEYNENLQISLLSPINRAFKVEEKEFPPKLFKDHVLTLLDE